MLVLVFHSLYSSCSFYYITFLYKTWVRCSFLFFFSVYLCSSLYLSLFLCIFLFYSFRLLAHSYVAVCTENLILNVWEIFPNTLIVFRFLCSSASTVMNAAATGFRVSSSILISSSSIVPLCLIGCSIRSFDTSNKYVCAITQTRHKNNFEKVDISAW